MEPTQTASSQIDATLNALKGGLTAAAGAAGPNIAGWIKTLQDVPQLSGLSAELQKLHDALSGGAADSATIAQSLSTLGEHTTKAAASATPDSQAKLLELGQTLSAAASQLKG